MPRGGPRKGSGRPKSADTPEGKLRRELAIKALTEGRTPLEVMLEAMRDAYDSGGAAAAFIFAKECAPFMHPKLSAVEAKVDGTLGTYEAQPIPVEQRDPVESAAGTAAGGDTPSSH